MPDFLELAKNGSTNAIEVLMNKSFGSQGVVVHIASVGSTLKVTLKTPSEPGPDKNLAGRVNAGLRKISPKGFNKAFIAAKTMKSDKTIWSMQLGLKPAEVQPESQKVPSPRAAQLSKVRISGEGRTSSKRRNQLFGVCIGVAILVIGGVSLSRIIRGDNVITSENIPESPSVETQVTEALDTQSSSTKAEVIEAESVEEAPSLPSDQSYEDAISQALAAVDESKTAVSHDEWNDAAKSWDEAISLMKRVPESNENYTEAQNKIDEYQRNLEYAQEQSIASLPTIGASKAAVQNKFSQNGIDFSFTSSPLTDGTPRLLGTAPNDLALIELYGPEDKLTKAVMMTFIGRGISPDLLAAYNVAFLTELAPGYDWDSEIADGVDTLSSGSSEEVRIRAGDNVVSMTLTEALGVFMFLVTVEPG